MPGGQEALQYSAFQVEDCDAGRQQAPTSVRTPIWAAVIFPEVETVQRHQFGPPFNHRHWNDEGDQDKLLEVGKQVPG